LVASPFLGIGEIDAHIRQSGKVDVVRDTLKKFERYELQVPTVNLRNLRLIFPEVSFFKPKLVVNLTTNDLILIILG